MLAQNALYTCLAAGLRPDPLEELTALPRPPSCRGKMAGQGKSKRAGQRGGEMEARKG